MKCSEQWLRELVNPPVKTGKLAEQLTMAGLEVEDILPCKPVFSKVVVARVETLEALPQSEKLKICKVNAGGDARPTVVCGADNVRVGKHYPLALPGAVLADRQRVRTENIQGIVSEGMLCSGKELGLSEFAGGVLELGDDAMPGQALEDYLSLPDNLLEISLTPNRGDCLGMVGIAREVATLNNLAFSPDRTNAIPATISAERQITLHAAAACPRYCGRIIHDIDMGGSVPAHVFERLRRADIRSINPVVDLANYVMLETGQPMHVFDNNSLRGDIVVRYATNQEKLVLLDGKRCELSAKTLVIADDSGAVAMAGIMGGLPTAVSADTRSIFLESAWFAPEAIMGRARVYGLHTDASHRYERGVAPDLARDALERLSGLILGICGGQPGPVVEAISEENLPKQKIILFRPKRLRQVLGKSISNKRILSILEQLGFDIVTGNTGWQVGVPAFRFDIDIEADLIEEVARIYGYQRFPATAPQFSMHIRPANQESEKVRRIKQVLAARGYQETISYSFVDPVLQRRLLGDTTALSLQNPISAEMAVMRLSLWPGLVQALLHNSKRQQPQLRLFEAGKVYAGDSAHTERAVIAGIIHGKIYKNQWDMKTRSCDFYDIKGDVETILGLFMDKPGPEFRPDWHPALHPGQTAGIYYLGDYLGLVGMLHPAIQKELSLHSDSYLFELLGDKIPGKTTVKFEKPGRFPSIRRDISIVLDVDIPAAKVMDTIKTGSVELLRNLELFDVYQGEGIDSGKKSLALGLTFQRTSSTLTNEEADAATVGILHLLHEHFGARLRE